MAWLSGTDAAFTFGGQTLVVANFGRWRMQVEKSEASFTPFGYAMEKVALGPVRCRGVLAMAVDSGEATPPIPNGTAGELKLTIEGGGSPSQYYTVNAVLTSIQIGASMTPFDITQAAYEFRGTASSSTSTVVAT